MRVALVQMDIVWEDRDANFERATTEIARAAAQGATVIALPEMFSYGFSMRADAVAEPVGGPTTKFLIEQATRHNAVLTATAPIRISPDTKPYNRLLWVSPTGTVNHYDKRHPFSFAKEHEHYASGDAQPTLTSLCGLRVTPSICYDLRFANDYWDTAHATDAYLVLANWPAKRAEHWRALLRARAIENQAYVIAVNRVGRGGDLDYSGDSAVIDPLGRTLVEAGVTPTLLVCDISAGYVAAARKRFPVMKDRR